MHLNLKFHHQAQLSWPGVRGIRAVWTAETYVTEWSKDVLLNAIWKLVIASGGGFFNQIM